MEPINKDDITVTKSYKDFDDGPAGIEYYIRLWSPGPKTVTIREPIPAAADANRVASRADDDLAWTIEDDQLVFSTRIDSDGVRTAYTYEGALKSNLSEWMQEPEIEITDPDGAADIDDETAAATAAATDASSDVDNEGTTAEPSVDVDGEEDGDDDVEELLMTTAISRRTPIARRPLSTTRRSIPTTRRSTPTTKQTVSTMKPIVMR
ncbi:hypothetical protein [Halonotius sp. GCM10025705]|uniref:hypothetical protein n=1 Tax=Halonotius sp. GCM10025705 TaxID=3252678 RepID=UPI0036122103